MAPGPCSAQVLRVYVGSSHFPPGRSAPREAFDPGLLSSASPSPNIRQPLRPDSQSLTLAHCPLTCTSSPRISVWHRDSKGCLAARCALSCPALPSRRRGSSAQPLGKQKLLPRQAIGTHFFGDGLLGAKTRPIPTLLEAEDRPARRAWARGRPGRLRALPGGVPQALATAAARTAALGARSAGRRRDSRKQARDPQIHQWDHEQTPQFQPSAAQPSGACAIGTRRL